MEFVAICLLILKGIKRNAFENRPIAQDNGRFVQTFCEQHKTMRIDTVTRAA